jgi:MPBQ/MSBQ methyltransferase
MPDTSAVERHYTAGDLADRLLIGLRAAGADPDHLRPEDVAPIDQLHVRGRSATLELAELAGIQPGWHVLDVGGGLGGSARLLASRFRCQVTVLEVTREFVQVGAWLSERMDLAGLVHFRHGTAVDMPFDDGRFDAVWTQHSTMHIEDKRRLFEEIHRVLRPGGRLALHEVAAGREQPVIYPTLWSTDGSGSHLLTSSAYRLLVGGLGFRELAWVDVTEASLRWFRKVTPPPGLADLPPLGPHLILGDDSLPAQRNQLRNLAESRLEVFQAAFERV